MTSRPMSPGAARLIIEPGRVERRYWSDLWRYRELFFFLAWRDVLVRYKQTAIGLAWAVLRPLLTMVVLTVLFGMLAKLPSGNVPYALLVLAAMLPWQLFAGSLADASASLVGNANLVSKVYFPRLIVPLAAIIANLVDFAVAAALLAALMAWYGWMPDWRVLALPFFVLLALVASAGFGLLFTAYNVQYRDVRYVIPYVLQLGLYVSPVGFSSAVVPDAWRLAYALNPMVGVIDGFRWSLLGQPLDPASLAVSTLVALAALAVGLARFRRVERSFADVI